MNCPKCNKEQHYTCGNEKCVCNSRVPKGEKPQLFVGGDLLACPYCGFTEHIDFWYELEIKEEEDKNESN